MPPSVWRPFLALAGALPFLLILPLVKLMMLVSAEVRMLRAMALWGTLSLALVGAALVGALAWACLPRWLRAHGHQLAWPFFAVALGNLLLLGFTLRFITPLAAPPGYLEGALALVAIALLAFGRHGPATRRMVVVAWLGFGWALLLAPAPLAPWIVLEAWRDRPHLDDVAWPTGAAVTPREDAPKRIILVSFDALRYQSTTLADPTLDTTPALAALARESLDFSGCRAAGLKTRVSVATMLTGMPPDAIYRQIHNPMGYLRQGNTASLGRWLGEAGYTSLFVTSLIEPKHFGWSRDFDTGESRSGVVFPNEFNTEAFVPWRPAWRWLTGNSSSEWRNPGTPGGEVGVSAVEHSFADARRLLDETPGRTFLWLHLGAPHAPMVGVAPSDVGGPYHLGEYPVVWPNDLDRATRDQLPRFQSIYERYVRFADGELGKFVDALRADGRWGETMLVVTSDHGESFGFGHAGHGSDYPCPEVARVPLLIHLPGMHAPRRVSGLCAQVDLAPTVLARVYPRMPDGFSGLDLVTQAPPARRVVYTWGLLARYVKWAHTRQSITAFQGDDMLVRTFVPPRRDALYDLATDPWARHDIARRKPALARELRAAIAHDVHL